MTRDHCKGGPSAPAERESRLPGLDFPVFPLHDPAIVSAGQRRTLGIPRPIQEMISRWISLLPPPKVKITAER